jgi:hypothetical protein
MGALLAVSNKAVCCKTDQQAGIVWRGIVKQLGSADWHVCDLGNAERDRTSRTPTFPPLVNPNKPGAEKQGSGDKREKGSELTPGHIVVIFPVDREVSVPVGRRLGH